MAKYPVRGLLSGGMAVARGIAALDAALTPPADRPRPVPLDPMAGFANGPELQRYAMQRGSFFVGRIHSDHGENFPAGVRDDRHIFIVAGSRAGKGLTLGIPNALTWPGPLFMIDPKGEAAGICALRRASAAAAEGTGTSVRAFMGQKVAILDPRRMVRGPARAFRLTYNPLHDIDMTKGGGVANIHAAAEALITQEQGTSEHFSDSAETIVSGVLEAMKLTEPEARQNLPQMRSLLLSGFDALRAYLEKIDTRAALAQDAVNIMDEVGGDEWGSFVTTLSKNFKWLAEPDMQDHLAAGAFSLRRAVQEGWSIFVALPPMKFGASRAGCA